MKGYSHIIFDIDGTLVDTYKTGLGSLQVTIEEFLHRTDTLESLEIYFGIPSFQAAEMLYPEDSALFLKVWEEHYQAMRGYSHFFDGALELLQRLKDSGKKLGIVTSRALYELQEDPIMSPVLDTFDIIVTSADSDSYKPEPGPALAFLAKAGVPAEECLYVGDTIFDSKCAAGAGIDFAIVDWTGVPAGKDKIPARYRVTNADEIYCIC